MTTTPSVQSKIQVKIGPETTLLPGALQPFMFRTRQGRLTVVGQMPVPLGTVFPGIYVTGISDDHGKTWRVWKQDDIPGGSPFHEGAYAQLKDGTILLLPYAAMGPDDNGDWKCTLWESRDNLDTMKPAAGGATFHLPQAKTGYDDDGHPSGMIFIHRTLLEMPNGDLLAPLYGWFKGDDTPSTYRPSMNKFRTYLMKSTDRGRNWNYVTTIAYDPSVGEEAFNEPVMIRIAKGKHAGRLLVHLRTGSNKTYKHNPIHQTYSDDDGKTWSKPQPLPFCGNVDPDLTENGLIVSSFGYRTAESRVNLTSVPKVMGKGHGNYVAFSRDGGDTWEAETQVTKEPSSCYTTVRQIGPGKLLLMYDIGDAWQHVWIGNENIQRSLGCKVLDVSSVG